jgi:hypothetical protein
MIEHFRKAIAVAALLVFGAAFMVVLAYSKSWAYMLLTSDLWIGVIVVSALLAFAFKGQRDEFWRKLTAVKPEKYNLHK